MKKIFVLDTNVLIHEPEAINGFEDNDVVIPIKVIEELDDLKRGNGEIPYSAREVSRIIDAYGENGDLSEGVELKGGGFLKIFLSNGKRIKDLDKDKNDNKIIGAAWILNGGKGGNGKVIVVSKDANVRIKARALKITAQDYLKDKTTLFEQHGNVIKNGGSTNGIMSVRYYQESERSVYRYYQKELYERIKLSKVVADIRAKNIEQECAIDALTNPGITAVALTGRAGTGKTLLAIAAGLNQSGFSESARKLYGQVIVGRPIVPMGNDLGFLPGDLQEKLSPWMQPIFDNLDVIMSSSTEKQVEEKKGAELYSKSKYLIESGMIHIESLTHIRGRSLPRRFIIIDEAQNLRPLDVKTIISRCGEGTKIVFTGDMEQIDHPFLDSASNGVAYLVKRFIDAPNFCYLRLKEGARSALAEQAAMLL